MRSKLALSRQALAAGFRTGVLWLCVLATLAGAADLHSWAHSLDPHGVEVPLAEVAGAADEAVFVCPTGHTPKTHVEAPRVAEAHRCAACLHRQQTRADRSAAASQPVADSGSSSVVAAATPAAAAPFLHHAPSRGPPAA